MYHLGSTSLVTDASGNVVSQQQYKAWGETRYSTGTEQTKYTYTGQYSYTSDFGLHFYNARWYDSSLSRFAQADTIIPASQGVQGYDRYAYVNNNPVKYTDPTGRCPWCIAIGVGAIAGAAVGYGAQVYNNYQNGLTGADALTTNISAEPIVNGAFIGAGVVLGVGLIATSGIIAAPVAAGAACADGDCTNEVNSAVNGANRACGGDMCASEMKDAGNAFMNAGLRFTQRSASFEFNRKGTYKGQTIGSLAEKIRSGIVSPSSVEINYIERGGLKLLENTRSSLALLRSGTTIEKWNLINRTGNAALEWKITRRLMNNRLTDAGTAFLQITGLGRFISNLR